MCIAQKFGELKILKNGTQAKLQIEKIGFIGNNFF